MTQTQRLSTHANDGYQVAFARSLIKAVGFEGAVRYCMENQWLGTLSHIEFLHRQHRTSR